MRTEKELEDALPMEYKIAINFIHKWEVEVWLDYLETYKMLPSISTINAVRGGRKAVRLYSVEDLLTDCDTEEHF